MPSPSDVTILNPDKCDHGYTLYSSRFTEEAHLIDIEGREAHRWEYAQGEMWHYAEMLPNGHLVVIIKELENEYPGMILELDWEGRLVWKADVPAHHDFQRLADGNTLVVCREYVEDSELGPRRYKSDCIMELTPDNETVWTWHADRHVKEIAALVPVTFPLPDYDWGHMNTVESLPETPASRDPRFRPGNVIFSCRHINTIGVIDRETGVVAWAWGPGVVDKQHMPTMLPGGTLLIYDNGTALGRSRIIELDPLTEEIVWEYQADPPESFFSSSRGAGERLPNGNTFITESNTGRLFEVTPDGETVWEFLNPDLRDGRRQPLYRALRYPATLVEKIVGSSTVSGPG